MYQVTYKVGPLPLTRKYIFLLVQLGNATQIETLNRLQLMIAYQSTRKLSKCYSSTTLTLRFSGLNEDRISQQREGRFNKWWSQLESKELWAIPWCLALVVQRYLEENGRKIQRYKYGRCRSHIVCALVCKYSGKWIHTFALEQLLCTDQHTP